MATKINNKNVKMTTDIIPVTPDMPEPPPGTVLMMHGLTGTAWQRFYNDGKWHSTAGGNAVGWSFITGVKRDDTFIILMGEDND